MQSSKSKKIDNLLTSPERPKSQQQQEPIKKLIEIEICKNCSIHEWCTRHDEKKYKEQLEEVKKAIKTSCPDVEVIQSKIAQPRLGAFEILHGAKALFSKCKSGLWPHPPAIAQRVQLYFEDLLAGKDVSKYGNEKEVMYSPPKKKKDPMSSTHVTVIRVWTV
jgi:selT/selW/selH-like putative selenoprotein